ncbi:MAG: hypothetical protein U0414_27840 [Polyangiaceae bacterium]
MTGSDAPARPDPPTREDRSLRWLAALALAPAMSGAYAAVTLALPPPPTVATLVVGIGIGLASAFAALALASRAKPPLWANGVAVALALVGLIVAYAVGERSLAWVPVGALLLVAGAWGIGGAIGARVEHAGHMLPAACVAAAADLASVLHPAGPSHAIASSERALSVVALNVPLPGGIAAPVLGVGDLVFAAIAFGVATRHGVSVVRPLLGIALGASASIALAAVLERPIPALVAMGAFAVLLTPAFRSVRRADRKTTRIAVALSIAVAIALVLRAVVTREEVVVPEGGGAGAPSASATSPR